MSSTIAVPHKVAIIFGSMRKPGPEVTRLVHDVLCKKTEGDHQVDIALVDMSKFNSPVHDEPAISALVPALTGFLHKGRSAWSAEIAKYDAYIIVVPGDNCGRIGGTRTAAVTKQWNGKPVSIISYGMDEGRRVTDQLKPMLEGVGLTVCATRPFLDLTGVPESDTLEA